MIANFIIRRRLSSLMIPIMGFYALAPNWSFAEASSQTESQTQYAVRSTQYGKSGQWSVVSGQWSGDKSQKAEDKCRYPLSVVRLKIQHIHAFTHLPIHPSTHLPIHSFTHSPIYPSTHSRIHSSTGFSILENPFRYSGYYTDAESGMSYCNARYYSSELMTWITRDSWNVSNRYGYTDGNPVCRTDSNGHLWGWVGAGGASLAIIGAIVALCFAGATCVTDDDPSQAGVYEYSAIGSGAIASVGAIIAIVGLAKFFNPPRQKIVPAAPQENPPGRSPGPARDRLFGPRREAWQPPVMDDISDFGCPTRTQSRPAAAPAPAPALAAVPVVAAAPAVVPSTAPVQPAESVAVTAAPPPAYSLVDPESSSLSFVPPVAAAAPVPAPVVAAAAAPAAQQDYSEVDGVSALFNPTAAAAVAPDNPGQRPRSSEFLRMSPKVADVRARAQAAFFNGSKKHRGVR